ncbi:MAG: hypothetical protein AABZ33_14080 [Chloroflexota bacterium]
MPPHAGRVRRRLGRRTGALTVGPWSPDWLPDLSGRRLTAIRAARRGAVAAAAIFGTAAAIAVMLNPAVALDQPVLRVGSALLVAAGSIPGLALLGAALTSSALDSRPTALVAALAMGLAAPTAAAVSAMIGVFVIVGLVRGIGPGFEIAGQTLEAGVEAALGIAPLLVLASSAWVLVVRRWAPHAAIPSA